MNLHKNIFKGLGQVVL